MREDRIIQIYPPEGAELLKVGTDDSGQLSLWALVDTGLKSAERTIQAMTTGSHAGRTIEGLVHIDTLNVNGCFEHFFERLPVPPEYDDYLP